LELYNTSNNNKKKRFNHLKKLLTKDDILYTAWNNINKSSTAAGVDNLTAKEVERTGVSDFIKSTRKPPSGAN
jgi:RNA-directed DNA polymerase